jgi:hypothetical protein
MTAVTDEKGRVLLLNSYRDRILVRQDFGNGQVFAYRYTGSMNALYAETADVTMPDNRRVMVETGDSVPDLMKNPSKWH